jgi:hypothetical protein
MKKASHHRIPTRTALRFLVAGAGLTAILSLGGCATLQEETKGVKNEAKPEYFARANALFSQGNYEAAFKENQTILAEGKGPPDIALFNMGLVSAHSMNPKKDYPRALGSFRTLVRDHPKSPLSEQAKIWIQVLAEHQKIVEEKQKLIEEKRTLTREREVLSQEREKLKYTVEKSRQVDMEIEKRRRQTLSR